MLCFLNADWTLSASFSSHMWAEELLEHQGWNVILRDVFKLHPVCTTTSVTEAALPSKSCPNTKATEAGTSQLPRVKKSNVRSSRAEHKLFPPAQDNTCIQTHAWCAKSHQAGSWGGGVISLCLYIWPSLTLVVFLRVGWCPVKRKETRAMVILQQVTTLTPT